MPAVIDPTVCNRNFDQCFPAQVCPEKAFSLTAVGDVVIDSSLCGECSGPCLNFCDGYAIRYERDPALFDVLNRQTLGEISEIEAAEERVATVEEQKLQEAEAANQGKTIVDVTAATFEAEVINADLPVVVDFWAPWCGPCQQMAPVFEELAGQYTGLVKFAKVNTDEERALAQQMGITGLPTVVAFYNGQPIDGRVGALPKPQLQAFVYTVLAATQQPAPANGDDA